MALNKDYFKNLVLEELYREEEVIEESLEDILESLSDEDLEVLAEAIESGEIELTEEEIEQLDELSRKTLTSYTNKAAQDLADKAYELGAKKERADEVDRFTNRNATSFKDRDTIKKMIDADQNSFNKTYEKVGKRRFGIKQATKRLAKEESEQIDELTGSSYENLNKIAADKLKKGDYDGSQRAYDLRNARGHLDTAKHNKEMAKKAIAISRTRVKKKD